MTQSPLSLPSREDQLTVRQALDHVGVGRSTLYRLIADGIVPAARVGRRVLLHVDTVRALAPSGGAR